MRVICDTNIWYHFADGTYKWRESLPFCLTALSLKELISSPGWIGGKRELILKTIQFIKEVKPPYIPYFPFGYIAKNIFKEENNEQLPFDWFLKCDFENTTEVQIQALVSLRNERVMGFKDRIQEFYSPEDIDVEKLKKLQNREDLLNQMVRDTLKEMAPYHNLNQPYESAHVQMLEQLELFLLVRGEYVKKLSGSKNYEAHSNDQVDAYNLVYVRPGDKYFVKDKKWLNLITHADLKKFLFSDQELKRK